VLPTTDAEEKVCAGDHFVICHHSSPAAELNWLHAATVVDPYGEPVAPAR
jgi:hypothetical protein